MNEQLILASASPRRKELLDQIGINYIVCPVDIDETPEQAEAAQDYVIRVAAEKSEACVKAVKSPLPVLAADTSVVIDGCILGKPENEAHAAAMLSQLSGKTHYVYSAISLRTGGKLSEHSHFQAIRQRAINNLPILRRIFVCLRSCCVERIASYATEATRPKTDKKTSKVGGSFVAGCLSITEVSFRLINVKEIQAYWQTGEPKGKAGSYAIQGLASIFVESIKGSFSGVVGLPLFETAELLTKQGIRVST